MGKRCATVVGAASNGQTGAQGSQGSQGNQGFQGGSAVGTDTIAFPFNAALVLPADAEANTYYFAYGGADAAGSTLITDFFNAAFLVPDDALISRVRVSVSQSTNVPGQALISLYRATPAPPPLPAPAPVPGFGMLFTQGSAPFNIAHPGPPVAVSAGDYLAYGIAIAGSSEAITVTIQGTIVLTPT